MRTRTVLAAAAAVLALGAAACGSSSSSGGSTAKPVDPNQAEVSPPGDIPDNQAFVAYAPPGGGFSVKVPEGWSRTGTGATVTFTDKLNSIRMQTMPASRAPTVAGAKRSVIPKLARGAKHFALRSVSIVRRSAGPALRIAYLADARPDAVTGRAGRSAIERYVFFHHGRDVVLTLSGAKGADNVDPWKLVTDSLRFTR